MKRPISSVLSLCLLLLVTGAAAQDEDPPPAGETPREIGLVEEARTRLAQLDVTVTGPADVIGTLTAADFELVLVGKTIDAFTVDRVCPAAEPRRTSSPAEPAAPVTDAQEPTSLRMPVTYLFYFDQHHLTHGRAPGRRSTPRATSCRDLVRDGNRGHDHLGRRASEGPSPS